jgi:DNA-binding response OmpR family regulator
MKKILVCDDDPVSLSIVYTKFKNENFGEIVKAMDGKQGIDLIAENHFDLIITDLQMPLQTGLDLSIYVRKQQKKDTPIIILSSEGMESVVLEAFEIGVNDFVTKPFSVKELIDKAKKLL